MKKIWILASMLCACAGQTVEPGEGLDPEVDPADAPQARVLAELTWPTGQSVVFLETGPDEVAVHETGMLGARPILDREADGLVDLYTQLSPKLDPHVLEVLGRADEYTAELDREAAADDLPPELEAPTSTPAQPPADGTSVTASALSNVGAIIPLTPAEFQSTFCNSVQDGFDGGHCALTTTYANTGWPGETSFIRSAVVHASGAGSVTHQERKWVCIQSLPFVGCVSWDWRTTATQTVRAGQYGIFTNEGRRTRYQASCPSTTRFHFGAIWDFR